MSQFLCVGSHWGAIHLLDHQGNAVEFKTFQAHTVAVNQISIDQNGDYIASCSDDGRVFIISLYNSENTQNMCTGRLVKCISIDPNYFKTGNTKRFITGKFHSINYLLFFFLFLQFILFLSFLIFLPFCIIFSHFFVNVFKFSNICSFSSNFLLSYFRYCS